MRPAWCMTCCFFSMAAWPGRDDSGWLLQTAAIDPATLGPGHPSDRRRLNPCQDSRAGVALALASDAPQARPCPRSCKASGSGAGGMAALAASRATADVAASNPSGGCTGAECAAAPTCPKGQRKAAAARRGAAPGDARRPRPNAACRQRHSRGLQDQRTVPARRAPRALEVVCRAGPHRAGAHGKRC
jgi:hypothetical protein